MSVDLAASLVAVALAAAALIFALILRSSVHSHNARQDSDLASAIGDLQQDRAELMATSEHLRSEYAQMLEEIGSTLSAEAENAAAFREDTVREVAEILGRHVEMLRTEMAAVVSRSDE